MRMFEAIAATTVLDSRPVAENDAEVGVRRTREWLQVVKRRVQRGLTARRAQRFCAIVPACPRTPMIRLRRCLLASRLRASRLP